MVSSKIKTSIVIDREVWEAFKKKVALERGLRNISQAIEEAIEDEVVDILFEKAFIDITPIIEVKPIKPRVKTNAGKTIREMRDSRL
ncbi:MAG: hypothetical protein DRN95_02905 [Candidatus Hydrothermarchaeota archaeon]|nr:MAG: hypothetical protein DRN95_02905 [Candidatus Hydrothermarchaeota archaeon]